MDNISDHRHEIFRETAQTLLGNNRDVRHSTKDTVPYLVPARTILPRPSEHTDEAQQEGPRLGTGYGVGINMGAGMGCHMQDSARQGSPSHPIRLHPAREWAGK